MDMHFQSKKNVFLKITFLIFFPLLPKKNCHSLVLKHCELSFEKKKRKKSNKKEETVTSSFGSHPSSHLLPSVITVNVYNV